MPILKTDYNFGAGKGSGGPEEIGRRIGAEVGVAGEGEQESFENAIFLTR